MQNNTLSRKLKNAVWSVLNILNIGGPIQLMLTGALKEDGWFISYRTKTSVDRNGNPIPWCSYPFIKFLEPRLKKSFSVFEYGSGNSTLWYAQRVFDIKAVEHDKEWYEIVKKKLPANASVVYRELDNGIYSRESAAEKKKYNIIIIDGRDRNKCVSESINHLADDGVIIYDNTQVPEYAPSIELLLNSGFRKIDFIGPLPIVAHNNTTTIFYRTGNCLGI